MLLGEKPATPSRTDWARIEAMTEEDIERNAENDPDNLPILPMSEWKIIDPPKKQSIHLRIDADVLAWFKENSTHHLTHMNSVLRKYMQSKS